MRTTPVQSTISLPKIGEAWIVDHVRSFTDGFAAKGIPVSEIMLLPRNAWPGSWSRGAAMWSGDTESSFQELAMQVTTGQGLAMSGIVLWTTDIGG